MRADLDCIATCTYRLVQDERQRKADNPSPCASPDVGAGHVEEKAKSVEVRTKPTPREALLTDGSADGRCWSTEAHDKARLIGTSVGLSVSDAWIKSAHVET